MQKRKSCENANLCFPNPCRLAVVSICGDEGMGCAGFSKISVNLGLDRGVVQKMASR